MKDIKNEEYKRTIALFTSFTHLQLTDVSAKKGDAEGARVTDLVRPDT
jgi:hypothetical protein